MAAKEDLVNEHPDYFSYEWAEHMRTMLGEQVVVTVSRDPLIEYSGRLMMFSDEGDVCYEDETGCRYYCWPNLDTRRVDA